MKSKTPAKKKKVKLQVDTEINFKLIGISSHENDYRLVWAINNQLQTTLIRTGNLVVHNSKLNTDLEFSCYIYHDEERYMNYKLISNRCPDGFLFPGIKNVDFLLQIIGEMSENDLKGLIKNLKTVEVISASFLLDPEKLKGVRDILQE